MKKFKFNDGTETTVNDIIDNADFRPEKFKFLGAIFVNLSTSSKPCSLVILFNLISRQA